MGVSTATGTDYRDLLLRLLPVGPAWPRLAGTDLANLLHGLGDELARVHNTGPLRVMDEADPRTAEYMLDALERVYGLPSDCMDPPTTVADRRLALHAKMIATGGQSAAYYIAVALALGYTITITEPQQFRASSSRIGDAVWGDDWRNAFIVTGSTVIIRSFRVGNEAGVTHYYNRAGEPLARWESTMLECVLHRIKPAHTYAVFFYDSSHYA